MKNKPLLIITVGASCSGKSTWADNFVSEQKNIPNENPYINLNRDKVRFLNFTGGVIDWNLYKFNQTNERKVTEIILSEAESAKEHNFNIIVSDTNINPKIRGFWISWAKDNGYDVVTKEFPVDWETLLKRNISRLNGLPTGILRDQYLRMNEYLGRRTYEKQPKKPDAVLIDLDGTVAQMVGRSPFEWSKVKEDIPRGVVISMVQGLLDSGLHPIFLSGRDGVCKDDTYRWIQDFIMECYLGPNEGFELFMRDVGDQRKDTVVKEELFWKYVAHRYNIVAAVDDRPCMVDLWYELKIPNVIAVANPHNRF